MEKNRCKIPTDRLITLENIDDGVVCNVCAGHKANEALGRYLYPDLGPCTEPP